MTQVSMPSACAGTTIPSPALLVQEPSGVYRPASPQEVIGAATTLLQRDISGSKVLDSPKVVRDFLVCRLGALAYEMFGIVLLTSQHEVIEVVEMFRGTVDRTAVYPREVVMEVLTKKAAYVILFHNHPSGCPDKSVSDQALTCELKKALALIDVEVLDHFVIAGARVVSFAENGWI